MQSSVITTVDIAAITDDWPATQRRRCELIERESDGAATVTELSELDRLQWLADLGGELFAPQHSADQMLLAMGRTWADIRAMEKLDG
jgi:hypothetical protein